MKLEQIKQELELLEGTSTGQIARVVRHGKVVRRRLCPKGYKLVDGMCKPMSASEKGKRHRGSLAANRKGVKKRIKSRRKANKIRKRLNIK